MLVTDAQVHVYEPDSPEHPWPRDPDRSSAPARHASSFTAEEMGGAMGAVGVDRAVIVPPVWAGEDNTPALAAAERYAGRFAVMGRLDPYAADTPERLERWLEQPYMLGIRMSGRWGTGPTRVDEAFADPSLEWWWDACERLGIPLMVLTRQFARLLAPIAERHPDLALIVDHLGTREAETAAEAFDALDDLMELARLPRVYVKVGTAPNRSRQPFPFEDVHPYLRRVYEAFGPRRMLWEADITQLTKNTYAECLRLWQEGLPFLTDDDREWILGRSAAEALNWPEA
ncbi:MAG: amidohydrolase family protein [Dehalococcoidia bacterium]|nr:amidohydrolase family protein [Dehalococcoidia bacterium]